MTAKELLAALVDAGCRPAVEGAELVLAADPPDALAGPLDVLHTAIRSLLAGKRWYGLDPATGRTVVLDPAARIPHHVGLVAVEGESELWDRLHPLARLDLPHLFAAEPEPDRGRSR